MWPDRRLLDLFNIDHPIVLAPMANAMDAELAIAVANAGGLGSLPAGMLDAQRLRAQTDQFRAAAAKPLNLNFFAHKPPVPNNAREHAWREKLKPYYLELGVDPAAPVPVTNRAPFDAGLCEAVEALKPEVVSFHYGLPEAALVNRVIRELGPISPIAPEFPLASGALVPLHLKAQAQGSGDFSPMLAGQAAALGRELPARELTARLVEETQSLMKKMAG
jgi:NAD(P)H-dependent flavin oxidoreductase YrpB (nitropropane dioxygenase family)